MSKEYYRKTITYTKSLRDGFVCESGIIDFKVNPEYIPKNILVEIQDRIEEGMRVNLIKDINKTKIL